MAKEPFLGVPKGNFNTETPDGVFRNSPDNHSLYDARQIPNPVIPGDFDNERQSPSTTKR